ncbi:hypothetical protein N7512_007829 [Penicillium capsulatum]|nr:hypothetical protein N7512_007829 [Penicillium capsulatum]
MRMQRPTPFGPTGTKVLRLGPGSAMPNLYANHIRMEVVCTMDALYTLGMHIGITEELLCADESISPFFRFSADATDDSMEATMIKSVQAIFKTLKPDMRPSREQISIKHHPCVDIIPFPTLRNNLIRHQADIDEDEFLVDMLTGLVCWGGAGLSRRDRQEASCISTGTPWDSRSWEAKEWFLQKYWALIGGEDSELARQTDWWRNMRGDDIEVSS